MKAHDSTGGVSMVSTAVPCRPRWAVGLALAWAALVGLVGLAGCDNQRVARLEEGVSTEADVRREFGSPAGQHRRADGSLLLEYPRQPEGWTNYEIVIGADGRMSSLRQLLHEGNFATVKPGMDKLQVRAALGRPARSTPDRLQGQEVWDWRYRSDPQTARLFSVWFDTQGRVVRTASTDDPDAQAGSR